MAQLTFVNTCYLVVSSKNEVYECENSYEEALSKADSYNNMTTTYKDDIPFRAVEIPYNTKINIL
jgi:hypothetical protein